MWQAVTKKTSPWKAITETKPVVTPVQKAVASAISLQNIGGTQTSTPVTTNFGTKQAIGSSLQFGKDVLTGADYTAGGIARNTVLGLPGALKDTLTSIPKTLYDQFASPSAEQKNYESKILPYGSTPAVKTLTAPSVFAARMITRFINPGLQPLANDIAEIKAINEKGGIAEQVAAGKIPASTLDEFVILQKTAPQIVGDVAQAVLTAYAGGQGEKLLAGSVKQPIKTVLSQGFKSGLKVGTAFGAGQALSSGSKNPLEIASMVGTGGAVGGVLGAILSGTIPVSKEALVKVKEAKGIYDSLTPRQKSGGYIQNPLGGEGKPSKLDELQMIHDDLLDTQKRLSEDPISVFKKLEAKTGEFKGGLREVKGVGKSRWEREGDQLAAELGMTSEEARVAYDKWKDATENIKPMIQSYKEKIKAEKLNPTKVKEKLVLQSPDVVDPNLPKLSSKNAPAPKFERQPEVPVPKGVVGLTKRNIIPLKYVDKPTAETFRTWNKERIVGKENAIQTAQNIKIEGDSMDLINKYQAGETVPQSLEIKKIFDDLHKEATQKGVDVEYLKDYIPQVYKGSPADIQKAIINYLTEHGLNNEMVMDYVNGIKPLPDDVAMRLKVTPTFSKERVFANYKVAAEYGLKPKYEKVSDLAAWYKGELDKTVANKKLITQLEETGKIMPDAGRNTPRDWTAINTQFSNKTYRAPANVAKVLNSIFADPNMVGLGARLAEVVGKTSKFAQEITLSAGVPNTTINFFAIGQLVKEVTSGNFKAINSFLRANLKSATAKFFVEHKQTLMDMANEGIDVSLRTGTFESKSMMDLIQSKEWGQVVGHGLDKAFGEKTFQSFMPMMQAQLFEDVVKNGLKKGLSAIEAKKLAGETIRNNFGLNTDAFAQSQVTKDTLSAFFFAPKFRESIVRSLYQTGKAGGDFFKLFGGKKIDPSLARNRRLIVGMILTYTAYNLMNRKLNDGQDMWENPSGKEFALRIPRENGEVIYIDFMPSFLSFARNIGSGIIATAKGDISTAGQKFGSVFSMPLKITSEVLSNKDYFGNAIYKDTDTGTQKALKIAKYVGLQVNHAYVREAVNQIQDKKPLYQSIVVGLELPLKFSTEDKESTSKFFGAMDEKAKETARAKEKFTPVFKEIQDMIRAGKTEEAQTKLDALPDEEYAMYKSMKTSAKSSATFSGKAKMYETYNTMQDLIKSGQTEKAQTILESFSEDEYKYYQLLKKQFGSGK